MWWERPCWIPGTRVARKMTIPPCDAATGGGGDDHPHHCNNNIVGDVVVVVVDDECPYGGPPMSMWMDCWW